MRDQACPCEPRARCLTTPGRYVPPAGSRQLEFGRLLACVGARRDDARPSMSVRATVLALPSVGGGAFAGASTAVNPPLESLNSADFSSYVDSKARVRADASTAANPAAGELDIRRASHRAVDLKTPLSTMRRRVDSGRLLTDHWHWRESLSLHASPGLSSAAHRHEGEPTLVLADSPGLLAGAGLWVAAQRLVSCAPQRSSAGTSALVTCRAAIHSGHAIATRSGPDSPLFLESKDSKAACWLARGCGWRRKGL